MVQLTQPWLAMNGRSEENPVVAWSAMSSVYSGILRKQAQMPVKEMDLLAIQGQAKQAKSRSFLLCSCIGFLQKAWPRLKVSSQDLALKICIKGLSAHLRDLD